MNKTLSIIIPTYNELNNIIRLVDILLRINSFGEWQSEVIIVDDNSPDGTGRVAQDHYVGNTNVKVIIRRTGRGLAKSIREGIEASSGDYIAVMDSDFSHLPRDLRIMQKQIYQADLISASRFVRGSHFCSEIRYKLSSFLVNLFIRAVLGLRTTDNTNGFFLIRHEALKKLDYSKIYFGYGDYFYRLLFHAGRKGLQITEIPTTYRYRMDGISKTRMFVDGYKYFSECIKLRFQ